MKTRATITPGLISKQQAYDVYIKEKKSNKFKRVAKNLPINRAKKLGRDITDKYLEASFRLKKAKSKLKAMSDIMAPDMSKFRMPKKGSKLPQDTFIEKRKYRLDSAQELNQISYFRQLKQKKIQMLKVAKSRAVKRAQIKNTMLAAKPANFIGGKRKTKNVKWL